MRAIFLLAIFCLPGLATADSYTYRDGYYWRGATAYTRAQNKVYTAPNCYYYRYDYYPVKVIEKVVERVVEKPVYPPPAPQKGWRQQLLEMAEARDKYEQAQAAAARDHKEYIEAIKVLGLNKGPTANPYGYAYTQNVSAYGNAAQGNTVYGYSLSSVSDVLGDNQVGVWMQQAARAQQAAQVTAEKGLGGIFNAIDLEGSNRARVAQILAKAEVLKSLDTAETHTQTRVEVQGALPPGTIPPPPQADPQAPTLQNLFGAKCAKCHSQQGTIQGKTDLFPQGVDLGLYPNFTYEQKRRVLDAVLDGSMPKNGDPLSIEETGLIYADVLATKQSAKQD
jgi:mono/diheme cytochrome c family protein